MASSPPTHLVVVESPAKARTIERYLGPDYKVLASYGHVRQLPSKKGSVDTEHDFAPKYEVIDGNQKHIAAIKKSLKTAPNLILATDLDREGEAIAWHLLQLVKPKGEVQRITFDEITKEAINRAIKQPRQINDSLVAAQETRQTLDYLYGFTLSPFLWKKVRYGLSAGRVQSVALRLIVEREREIEAFKAKEYWTLDAQLQQPKEPDEALARFAAGLFEDQGKKLGQFDLAKERATELAKELPEHPVTVKSVETKQRKRSPSPPFTTSTLQQEASRKLGFGTRRTMRTAQKLYEGVKLGKEGSIGLITYMRTDSLSMAASAVAQAREVIAEQFGKEYVPEQSRGYRTKSKGAQEAHEAIRPTSLARRPEQVGAHLEADQLKLYGLIWKRALASQMADAQLDATTATFAAGADGAATLKATGQQVKFPGFIKVYLEGRDDPGSSPGQAGGQAQGDGDKLLPKLAEGDRIELLEATSNQHFTQPPPRYTEASLVKTLEEYGIGRPSTYASIITTIQSRKYVRLEERRFFPEEIGTVVSDILTEQFGQYVDYNFTARLEDKLDEIATGQADRVGVLSEWWRPFEKTVAGADATKQEKATGKPCAECSDGELIEKFGRFSKFRGCSRYPECKYMEPIETAADKEQKKEAEAQAKDATCPECGSAVAVKRGRYGVFLACTCYPECKGTMPFVQSTGVACPECQQGDLAVKKTKRGKIFYGCARYPKCEFAVWQEPVKEPCPECRSLVTKRGQNKVACTKCDWEGAVEPPDQGPGQAMPATPAAT